MRRQPQLEARITRNIVRRWMDLHAFEYTDSYTDELNYTGLAEGAAYYFEHAEWLDDETHWIWDLPIEVETGAMYENPSKKTTKHKKATKKTKNSISVRKLVSQALK